MRFYLIGIKGAGMTALANILLDLNYEVSGCDYPKSYFTTELLTRAKIKDISEFAIEPDYYYVIGNAFTNHEIAEKIKLANGEYAFYPEFIENFFSSRKVAVAGSHGKTTTLFFATQLLRDKVSFLCGDGSGAGVNKSSYFLFEACEYRNTFLAYHPYISLITNIDYDHPDYFKSSEEYFECFQNFASQSQILVINGDSSVCRRINHTQKLTFGFNENNDIKIRRSIENGKQLIKLQFYQTPVSTDFVFPFLGDHLVYDYAAALILAFLMNTPLQTIKQKSNELSLPRRRMNKYLLGDVVVIDDYAHHPTEIKATILTLKEEYEKPIYIIYQPHTYTRTTTFKDDYLEALSMANLCYILPVFSSVREKKSEINPLLDNKDFLPYNEEARVSLLELNEGVIVFMGAGDVNDDMDLFLRRKGFTKQEATATL